MNSNKLTISALLVFAVTTSLWAQPRPGNPERKAKPTSGERKQKAKPKAKGKGKAKPSPKGPGVMAMFNKGKKLYQAEKYAEATAAFDATLRRYPGHTPTVMLYAKALYKLNRVKDSYYLFARLNPQYLDVDTSYEYGQAFYHQKQYAGALYAFKRIPKDHPLFDLANYYGGVCAIRMRQFDEAEEMLDKALVLPDKLAKSKSLYLKHLAELRILRERQQLAQEKAAEKKRMRDERKARNRKDKGSKKPKKDEKPAAPAEEKWWRYAHGGFRLVERYSEVGGTLKDQEFDLHGFATKVVKIREGFFDFANGVVLPTGLKRKHGGSAFGLQVNFKAVNVEIEGREQRNFVQDTTPEIVRIQLQQERTLTKNGQVTIAPWLEFPLAHNWWTGGGGNLFFLYPDFEVAQRTGSRLAFLSAGYRKPGFLWVEAKVSYTEILDTELQWAQSFVTTELKTDYWPVKKLRLELDGLNQLFAYADRETDGPGSINRLTAKATYDFFFGIAAGGKGSFEYQFDNRLHNLPTYAEIIADGQVFFGEVFFRFIPVSWFRVQATGSIQQADWTVAEPEEAKETFERNQVDFLRQTNVEAAINLLF